MSPRRENGISEQRNLARIPQLVHITQKPLEQLPAFWTHALLQLIHNFLRR